MADDRIEIKIVTEGDAKGAEDVATALGKVGTSAKTAGDNVGPAGLSGKMAATFPTFAKWGTAVGGVATHLLSLASPAALAATAIAGITAAVHAYRDSLRAMDEKGDETWEKLGKLSRDTREHRDALGEAATKAHNLVDELNLLTQSYEDGLIAQNTAIDRTLALADAQDKLRIATIDARVAAGEITPEEGQAQKGEIGIAEVSRKVSAEQARAEAAKRTAEQTLSAAQNAIAAAQQDISSASRGSDSANSRVDRFRERSALATTQARMIQGGASAEEIVQMLGGDDAARKRLSSIPGELGRDTQNAMNLGARPEQVLQGQLQKNALAKQLFDEGATAAAAAERATKEKGIAALAEAEVAEKKKTLDALIKIRTEAEAQAAKAQADIDAAGFRAGLATQYEIPAKQIEVDTNRRAATAPPTPSPSAPGGVDLTGLQRGPNLANLAAALAEGINKREAAFIDELLGAIRFENRNGNTERIKKLEAQIADLRGKL